MRLLSEFSDEFRLGYNRLPSVEDASERLLSRPQFSTFLIELGKIANRYDLNDRIGAFLLHRHFDLQPGEMMLETPLDENGIPILVTRPFGMTENTGGSPSRWALSEDGTTFQPLEYSTDNAAIATGRQLQDSVAFLNDYAQLLRQHGVQDLLGLCIVDRAHLQADEKSMFVEMNRASASVVATQPRTSETDHLITTVWVPSVQAGCMPTLSCEWFCVRAGEHHNGAHRPKHGPHHRA